MKKWILLIVLCLGTSTLFAQEITKATYFLIRHAEKDRTDAENKNPSLTEKGKERALLWSQLLTEYGIEAVYATDYKRTQETAAPSAEKLGLEIQSYHPFKLDFEQFLKDTQGKKVLVVGHSNTIPFFVNKLIKMDKYQQMQDDDNASLYIVTIEGDTTSDIVIKTKN